MERWQNLGYLFWAYSLFWLLMAGYIGFLAVRLSRLRRDVDEIRRKGAPPRPSA